METQWILVANASLARLLRRGGDGEPMVPVTTFEHPEGRMTGRELGTDRVGHDASSHRPGGVMLEPRTDAHRKEQQQFAQQLAKELERGLEAHECGSILLFASPLFLGILKAELPAQVAKAVRLATDVDLTSYGLSELEQRVARELAAKER